MKIKEILYENAIAGYGDWEQGDFSLGYISLNGLERYYTKLDTIKTELGVLEFYKINSEHLYILGRKVTRKNYTKLGIEKETKLEVLFKISLTPKNYVNLQLFNVDSVVVKNNIRTYGLAITMYRYLIKKLQYNLMGDELQYFGARKLWTKLSKMLDITVDIIDIETNTYLEKNVVIHHGLEDWDYDLRVWGANYSDDIRNVRLILKDL